MPPGKLSSLGSQEKIFENRYLSKDSKMRRLGKGRKAARKGNYSKKMQVRKARLDAVNEAERTGWTERGEPTGRDSGLGYRSQWEADTQVRAEHGVRISRQHNGKARKVWNHLSIPSTDFL